MIEATDTRQRCGGPRLARCSDRCSIDLTGRHTSGYVPRGIGVGGDNVPLADCLDCGRLRGQFPLPLSGVEDGRPSRPRRGRRCGMGRKEREAVAAETRRADAAQRKSDHQRWADDGGFIPRPETTGPDIPPVLLRNPWAAVAVAAGLGFALGWITGRR